MELKNKVILVTGGSGLIGKAIVNDINKKQGIAINADINIESNIKDQRVKMDITNEKSILQGIKLVLQEYDRIDGLVNNAYPRTSDWGLPFEEIPMEYWQKNVDIQMNSYFFLMQQVLKHMKKNKMGAIVNITSIYGVVGNDFTIYDGLNMNPPAAYSAIKGGIINLTRYLASLFGQTNIRINCVSPGGIFDNQNPEFVKLSITSPA